MKENQELPKSILPKEDEDKVVAAVKKHVMAIKHKLNINNNRYHFKEKILKTVQSMLAVEENVSLPDELMNFDSAIALRSFFHGKNLEKIFSDLDDDEIEIFFAKYPKEEIAKFIRELIQYQVNNGIAQLSSSRALPAYLTKTNPLKKSPQVEKEHGVGIHQSWDQVASQYPTLTPLDHAEKRLAIFEKSKTEKKQKQPPAASKKGPVLYFPPVGVDDVRMELNATFEKNKQNKEIEYSPNHVLMEAPERDVNNPDVIPDNLPLLAVANSFQKSLANRRTENNNNERESNSSDLETFELTLSDTRSEKPQVPAPASSNVGANTFLRHTIEEQNKIVANLYKKLAQVVFDRIAWFNSKDKYQKKHYIPFIKTVAVFNGVHCTPLPFKDAKKILEIINDAIMAVDIGTDIGDILCENVKRFFIDFNVFFLDKYERNDFGSKERLLGEAGNAQDHGKSFALNLKKDHELKIKVLKDDIIDLNKSNHTNAIKGSKAANGVSDCVVETLIYNQAQVVFNVKCESEEATTESWLAVLLQVPSEDRKIKDASDVAKSDTVARLLLARATSNQRLASYYEISSLKPNTDEYDLAISLASEMSQYLQNIFLQEASEYDINTFATAKKNVVIKEEELRELLLDMTQNNETIHILPLFAVERNSSLPVEGFAEIDKNTQSRGKDKSRKRKAKNEETLALEKAQVGNTRKKRKLNKSILINPDIATNSMSKEKKFQQYENLFEYLTKIQQLNVRKATKISDKLTRYNVQEFPFEKMPQKEIYPLPQEELEKLDKYLETTLLYPYQKTSVRQLISAHFNNVGIGLFDEMSLGKTIQIGATIKYLTLANKKLPFIIVVPLAVLLKWKDELITKLKFSEKQVVEYHGKARKLPKDIFSSNKVLITTPETLISELKADCQTSFQTACGYFAKHLITNVKCTAKNLVTWRKLVSELFTVIPGLTKSGKRIKFLKFPTNEELHLLEERYDLGFELLKQCFTNEIIFQYLNQQGFINKFGALLSPITNEDDFAKLYSNFKNFPLNGQSLLETIQNISDSFSIQGMIIDEAHHGLSNLENKTFIYLHPIAKNLEATHGLRTVSTGTPFQNDIQELWAIHEFLNSGRLFNGRVFTAAYEKLIFNAGKSICNAAVLLQSEHLDKYQEAMDNSMSSIQKAYDGLKKVIEKFAETQIRRTKQEVNRLRLQYRSTSSYNIPDKVQKNIPWNMSENQQQIFNSFSPESLEGACRGFAFFHNAMLNQTTVFKRNDNGGILLQRLAKIFDHPILDSEEHREELFSPKRTFESIKEYLQKIIENEYDNDIDNFIRQSGKLSALVEILKKHLNMSGERIMIATEFIAMMGILSLVITHINKDIKPLLYAGEVAKVARETLLKSFNEVGEDSETPRVIIISSKAGSEGIDVYAKTVVRYDQTWTDAAKKQILSRAERNGSPYEAITCYDFCGGNPLDQKMFRFVGEKREWASWLVDRDPGCTLEWFLNRLVALIKTSILFNHIEINDEKIEHTVNELKRKIEIDQSLSLEMLTTQTRVPMNQPQSVAMEGVERTTGAEESVTDNMEVDPPRASSPTPQPQQNNNALLEFANLCSRIGFFPLGQQPSNNPPPPDLENSNRPPQ